MYVDVEFYKNVTFAFSEIQESDSELARIIAVAEDIINAASMNRLADISKLAETQINLVKKAICAQVDYIVDNGGLSFLTENTNLNSVSLGNFSYSNNSRNGGANNKTTQAATPSPLGIMYLEQAGLLYRGVSI